MHIGPLGSKPTKKNLFEAQGIYTGFYCESKSNYIFDDKTVSKFRIFSDDESKIKFKKKKKSNDTSGDNALRKFRTFNDGCVCASSRKAGFKSISW